MAMKKNAQNHTTRHIVVKKSTLLELISSPPMITSSVAAISAEAPCTSQSPTICNNKYDKKTLRASHFPTHKLKLVTYTKSQNKSSSHLICQAASSDATTPPVDPFATRNQYSDSDPISKFMLYYFSKVMSDQLGGRPFDGTYDGFVDLSRDIMRGRNSQEQQQTVAGVLGSLLPPQAPANFRKWFPLNRRNAEFNAWITTLGFGWLVGPSKVVEVEVEWNGKTEKWNSGVNIEKCRYLENSGCVGMCTNMCKIPTEKFFTETFGLPLQMNPNFETLECEMIFGRAPVPIEQDPVYNQPCFSVCNLQTKSSKTQVRECPKVDTDRKAKGL